MFASTLFLDGLRRLLLELCTSSRFNKRFVKLRFVCLIGFCDSSVNNVTILGIYNDAFYVVSGKAYKVGNYTLRRYFIQQSLGGSWLGRSLRFRNVLNIFWKRDTALFDSTGAKRVIKLFNEAIHVNFLLLLRACFTQLLSLSQYWFFGISACMLARGKLPFSACQPS